MSRLDDYLNEISARLLRLGAEAREDILLEVRSHLEDSTRALQLRGLSKKRKRGESDGEIRRC